MNLNLPFQIGVDYEDIEFDLEVLPDRISGFDSYIYLGNILHKFMNYPTEKTELIFYWDKLEAVVMHLQSDVEICVNDLIDESYLLDNNENFSKFQIEQISLFHFKKTGIILYGNSPVLDLILSDFYE